MKITKKIKASGITSDVDNTLLATNSFVKDHITRTCKRIGIVIPSAEKISKVQKKNPAFEEIFIELFGKAKGKKVLKAYRETAPTLNYSPTPKAIEFIEKTDQLNIPVVIVTNRTKMIAERLEQAGFDANSFEDITSLDVPKPDQHAYDSAIASLNKLGSKRETILFLGDHPHDFLAVPEDLKSNFYAVLTGLNEAVEFEKLGLPAENILLDIGELIDIITRPNG